MSEQIPNPVASIAPAEHTKTGLDQSWDQLGRAGGWWTAAERIAIAQEKRAAQNCALCCDRKAALSPYSVYDQKHESPTTLADPVVDVIHRIMSDPGRLSQRWYDDAIESGVSAEQLVEITSIIGFVTIADTLSRALSIPQRPFPEAQDGEPHRQVEAGTKIDRAWVPMVEIEQAEGLLEMMYTQIAETAGFVFNVGRCLTAVPEAVRDFFSAFLPNYTTHGPVSAGGLNRSQVELLSSSTSAWNDCFY